MLVALAAFALLVSVAWAAPQGNAFFSGADSTGYAKTAINTNLPSGASSRSLSFWFLITPATDSAASPVPVPVDGFFYLLDIGSSASSYQTNNEWAVGVSPSSASMGSSYPSPSNSISALNISGCVNVWTHAAVVFQATTTLAYVNGVLVSQFSTGQTFGTDTNLELWLGARPAGLTLCTPACPGRGPGLWIDEVRVWNTAISSSDVVADMTTATPSNSASNKAWYSFDSAVAGATSAVSGTSDATSLTFSGAASVAVAPTQFVVIGAPASGVVPTAQSPLCTNVTVTSPSGGLSWGVRLQSKSMVIDNLTSWSDRAYSSSSNQVFSFSSALYLSDSKTSGILKVCASSSQTWTLNLIVHLSVFSCASGQYGSQCQTCSAGSYCALAAYAPSTCPVGSYCSAGVAIPTACSAAAVYCPSGSSASNLCPGGYYCPNATISLPCTAGYFCSNGSMTATGFLNTAATLSKIAGSGSAGAVNGVGTSASFKNPWSASPDSTSTYLYIADTGSNLIRRMDLTTMLLTTFAGSGTNATSNGIGVLASFNRPAGIAVDKTFIYVTEFAGNVVRRIDVATATVTIFAGSTSGASGFSNGIGNAALFNGPHSLAIDPSGLYLYVADSRNARIRRIEISTKTVTTIAGNGTVGCVDGSLVSGSFSQNEGLAVDPTGTSLYVADNSGCNSIRKINIATGQITTLAGWMNGTTSSVDGVGRDAAFNYPIGLSVDPSGSLLYVADAGGNCIRSLALASQVVTTVIGNGTSAFAEGVGSSSSITGSVLLNIDTIGAQMYTTSSSLNYILKVALSNKCSTGSYCPAASSAATSCKAGYYCPNSTVQIVCSTGYFCPSGSTVMNASVAGYFSNSTGLSAATVCLAGFYCPNSSTIFPVSCPAGSYCNSTGLSKVLGVCSLGYYCPAAASSLSLCPGGFYCPNTTSSLSCIAGSYCPSGSTSSSLKCPAGQYCPAKSSSPLNCPSGWYCNATGLSNFSKPCPLGSYCPNGTSLPFPCTAGSYCPVGSSTQNLCSFGSYCATPSTKQACSSIYYCPAGTSAVSRCSLGIPLISSQYSTISRSSILQLSTNLVSSVGSNPCFPNQTVVTNISYSWAHMTPAKLGFTQSSYSGAINISGNTINISSIANDTLTMPPDALTVMFAPFSLTSGRTYIFQLNQTASVVGYCSNIVSSILLAVVVPRAPLVATMAGGNRTVSIAVSSSQALLLDATGSYDPDVVLAAGGSNSDLRYKWACLRPNSFRACSVGSGSPVSSSTFAVPTSYFPSDDIWEPYVFYVIVSSASDGRTAQSNGILIKAVAADVPTAAISIIVSGKGTKWKAILPTDSVQLSAVASRVVSYAWSCTSGNLNIATTTSSVLSIVANSLSAGTYYSFSLTVCSGTVCTVSSVSFTVNQIPYGGTCTLEGPSVGVALQSKYIVTCSGWLDSPANYPLTYGLQQVSTGSTVSTMVLQGQQVGNSFSAMLPAGSPVLLRAVVQDAYGGQSFVPFSANVTNPSLSSLFAFQTAMSSAMSVAGTAFSLGDLNAMSQVISSVTQMMSVAANESSTNSTEGRALRTTMRTSLVVAMANMTDLMSSSLSASPSMLSQFVGQMLAISSVPSEMSADACVAASTMMASVAQAALSKSSSDTLSSVTAEYMMSSMSNMMSAMNPGTNSIATPAQQLHVATQTSSMIQSVGRGVLIGTEEGQKVISTPQLTVVATRSSVSQLISSVTQIMPDDHSGFGASLPPTLLSESNNAVSGQIDAVCSSLSFDAYSFAENSSQSVSPLVSLTLYSSSHSIGQSALNISGLKTPILITIPHAPIGNMTTTCRFWDEINQVWSTNGCSAVLVTSNITVCACSHLTTFNLAQALSPQITSISSQDVVNFFTWSNIVAHPIPVICCAALIALWIISSHCLQKAEEKGVCLCFDGSQPFKAIDVITDDDVDLELADLKMNQNHVHFAAVKKPAQDSFSQPPSHRSRCRCCFNLLDRRSYAFPLSTSSPVVAFTNDLVEMHRSQNFQIDVSLCSLICNSEVRHVVRSNLVTRILSMHPFWNVWFHNPEDPYTTYQRLQVVVASIFSMLAVSAVFYGINPMSLESLASVSIYSALLAAPVNFIFPRIFISVANRRRAYIEERRAMKLLHIKLPPKDLSRTGTYTLRFAYFCLWVWTVGCIFVCLVYGMQFDLSPGAVTTTTTSTLGAVSTTTTSVVRPTAAPRDFMLSLVWLYSVFTSIMFDLFVSGPIAIILAMFIAAMRARYNLAAELKRRAMLPDFLQIKWEDIVFNEQRIDEFASWIHHDLTWAPNFGQHDQLQDASTMSQTKSPDSFFGTIHKFGQDAAVSIIQSLAFGLIGGGAVMPVDLSSTPSLGDEISFVAKSAISVQDARQQAVRNASRITFDDHLFPLSNEAMHPTRKHDPPSELVIKFSTFHWMLRLQNVRPSQSFATELRVMHALRTAWLAASSSVRLSFVFDADYHRIGLERDLFTRLFLSDLATACGVTQSRFAIVDLRRWYGERSSSQQSYDQTVVTVDILPDQGDRGRAPASLQMLELAIRKLEAVDEDYQVEKFSKSDSKSPLLRKESAFSFRKPLISTVAAAPKRTNHPLLPAALNSNNGEAAAGPLALLLRQHVAPSSNQTARTAEHVTQESHLTSPELALEIEEDPDEIRVRTILQAFEQVSRVSTAAPQCLTSTEIAYKLHSNLRELVGSSLGFWLTRIHLHEATEARQANHQIARSALMSMIDLAVSSDISGS